MARMTVPNCLSAPGSVNEFKSCGVKGMSERLVHEVDAKN